MFIQWKKAWYLDYKTASELLLWHLNEAHLKVHCWTSLEGIVWSRESSAYLQLYQFILIMQMQSRFGGLIQFGLSQTYGSCWVQQCSKAALCIRCEECLCGMCCTLQCRVSVGQSSCWGCELQAMNSPVSGAGFEGAVLQKGFANRLKSVGLWRFELSQTWELFVGSDKMWNTGSECPKW